MEFETGAQVDGSRRVVVALVQQVWSKSADEHKKRLRAGVQEAAGKGAQLVALQELTLHRYFCNEMNDEYKALAEPLEGGATAEFCSAVAREFGVHLVGSLFERATVDGKERLFNTAAVWGPDGARVGFTRKQHIPKGTGYEEEYYFEPGNSDYPVHDLGFIKLAIPTCYDQWFPELARIYALKGAELILYPTAIGSEPDFPDFDSQPAWQHMMVSHAIANCIFVGAINRTGKEAVVQFYGSSFVCDPTGKVLAQAARDSPEVVVATLDFARLKFWRNLFPMLEQRHPETYGRLTKQL